MPVDYFEPDFESLAKGLYIPLDYHDVLLETGAAIGPPSGITLGYRTIPRHLDNELFIRLFQQGWIGSCGTTTDALVALSKDLLEQGRSMLVSRIDTEIELTRLVRLSRTQSVASAPLALFFRRCALLCHLRKGSLVLDLYHRIWDGKPLGEGDFVISADEKTSIQARRRKHPSTPPGADRPGRFEHEYERKGALAYLAAYDIHRTNVFGRCDDTTGITPFGKLVDHVMQQEPYRSATRVFWIVDNGSSQRGQAACGRVRNRWPNLILVHTPVHAS